MGASRSSLFFSFTTPYLKFFFAQPRRKPYCFPYEKEGSHFRPCVPNGALCSCLSAQRPYCRARANFVPTPYISGHIAIGPCKYFGVSHVTQTLQRDLPFLFSGAKHQRIYFSFLASKKNSLCACQLSSVLPWQRKICTHGHFQATDTERTASIRAKIGWQLCILFVQLCIHSCDRR